MKTISIEGNQIKINTLYPDIQEEFDSTLIAAKLLDYKIHTHYRVNDELSTQIFNLNLTSKSNINKRFYVEFTLKENKLVKSICFSSMPQESITFSDEYYSIRILNHIRKLL